MGQTMEKIETGHFYFIDDAFFDRVDDAYLKTNKTTGRRPHYCAIYEERTGLYWLIPCSSKVGKFEALIEAKKKRGLPVDGIAIVKFIGRKTALLLQDMFPITKGYITEQYFVRGQPARLTNPRDMAKINEMASEVIKMLRKGFKFTPTPPDVAKIEEVMLEEAKWP